ncbi:MAG: rod shape-determining protein MreD [Cyclobacteriaceae bacterium]|nr:rod shape-determining protein MreD [Cyclobacteriaceae bacterium]
MSRTGIWQFLSFFIYLLVQVVLMKNLVLFNTAFCFIYIAFILFLPIETNILLLMALGFVMGFLVDVFYDSLGMHASALVLVAFVRNFWLSRITPQGGYDAGEGPTLAANGLQWFFIYAFPLVFIHHFALFFIEAGGFGLLWYTFSKVFFSTIFTFLTVLLLQYMLPGQRRS